MNTLEIKNEFRILVACMPKSGSTFLSEVIANLPGLRRATLVPGYQRREQEICVKRLEEEIQKTKLLRDIWGAQRQLMSRPRGFVAQMHLRYTLPSDVIFREYAVVPVVLVRNIFDIVVSLRDHIVQTAPYMSMAYVSEEMRAWPAEKMYHFIADMAIPWYLNFFVSWSDSPFNKLVTYEQLTCEREGTLEGILDDCGLKVGRRKLLDAINAAGGAKTRKNKGIAGRGEALPDAVKEKILHYASYYPHYDLSPIGLCKAAPMTDGSQLLR